MYEESEFFLINKDVVTNQDSFLFNLYGRNKLEDKLSLVYEKGKSSLDALKEFRYLYVHEENRDIFEGYYNNLSPVKVLPKDLKTFYENVTNSINSLFENPESKEKLEEAKQVVTDMVDVILEEEFTVSSLITILSFDYTTHTHSLNVSAYAICVGKQMGLGKEHLSELGTAALLHDLGKTKINPAILHKHGKLSDSEFREMQNHPYYGWLLAKKIGITNKNILAGIRNHHEKIDGSGYPDRLRNSEIHLYAKIIGICDAFDAITTHKTYKDGRSTFDCLVMMKKEMSNQFDGSVINHLISIFKQK